MITIFGVVRLENITIMNHTCFDEYSLLLIHNYRNKYFVDLFYANFALSPLAYYLYFLFSKISKENVFRSLSTIKTIRKV
jgi:hypothetical protein